jgi:hypothetical protein
MERPCHGSAQVLGADEGGDRTDAPGAGEPHDDSGSSPLWITSA